MRITDLNTLVTASLSDILYIVDVSDTGDFISGSSKQITIGNFFSSSNVGGGGGGGGSGGSGYLVLTSSVVSSSVNIDSTVFTSNGVQTVYTVSGSVTEVADDVIVFINGVSQIPNVNYTLSSSILTFSGTPSSGSKIDVRRASSVLSVTFITSSMGVEYFTGNNSSSQFTLTNGQTVLHNYDVLISLDGLIQKPTTDYSITGSILNFTVPPPINTDVEVRYLSPQTFTLITGSGGSGGGTGSGNGPFGGPGSGPDDGVGPGKGSGSGKARVRINNVSTPQYDIDVDCRVGLKLTINSDGIVTDCRTIKSVTTCTNQTIINDVIRLVKQQVRFNKDPGAPLVQADYTIRLNAR